MDSLPQELLDAILKQLAVYDFPVSARFPVLDDESRRAILHARLVGRCFRNSKVLGSLFIAVLEETPFLWCGHQMPRLLELSTSKYAGQMSTLSLSVMNSRPWQEGAVLNGEGEVVYCWSPSNIAPLLQRFVRIKHVRYYPLSPKCLRKAGPKDEAISDIRSSARYGYPPDDEDVDSWLRRQPGLKWVVGNMVVVFVEADLALESVTFPLFGNRASYCGIHPNPACFPPTLKRLSISMTDGFYSMVFEPWLKLLKNLTFLEVAISRDPESLGPWNSFASCRPLIDTGTQSSKFQLLQLEEFRLMSDNQNCFSERDLLLGLEVFPNLRKLGLAHILIKSQTNNAASWNSFVKRLVPKRLERLWLLDPRHLWTDGHMGQAGHYVMRKYLGDSILNDAAQEVRLIDTESLWVPDSVPPKRRDFDYPGFAIFEQTQA